MEIRSSLSDEKINIQFFSPDDVGQPDRNSSETSPVSYILLAITEDEARTLLDWLRGQRVEEYRSSRLVARGSADWVIIETVGVIFTIRMGTSEMIDSLCKEISGILGLIMGKADSSSTLVPNVV